MTSRTKTAAALLALALGAAGACNRSTASGSETNWFGYCDSNQDCSAGHCICGICTEECDGDGSCPGGEADSCRASGSAAFSRVCDGAKPVPRGVCLHGCGGGRACGAGFECNDGACVPRARTGLDADASPGSTSQALSLTTFTMPFADGAMQFGACFPYAFAVDGAGEATCRVLVHRIDNSGCRCDEPGLRPPSEDTLGILMKWAHDYEFCGFDGVPPCEDNCFCELVQQSGAGLASCQRAGGPEPATPGWCYVDPGAGVGDPALVEQCDQGSRRLLRMVGDMPAGRLYLGCVKVEEVTPHAPPSPADIGAPCTPEDEFSPTFPFFSQGEVTIDSGSPSCASGVCVVANFRGRTSCPYGQPAGEVKGPDGAFPVDPTLTSDERCYLPGTSHDPANAVTVPVDPQFVGRPPADTVYCSCRCDGPAGSGPFCECPDGFACTHLIDERGASSDSRFAGSYCLKTGVGMSLQSTQVLCDRKQRAPRPVGCDEP